MEKGKKLKKSRILRLEKRSPRPKGGYAVKDYSPKSGNNQEEREESLLNGLENINSLEELAKHGARIRLSLALKNEVGECIEKTNSLLDKKRKNVRLPKWVSPRTGDTNRNRRDNNQTAESG